MAPGRAREETKIVAREQAEDGGGRRVAEAEAYLADTRIASPPTRGSAQVLLRSGELAPQGFPAW